MILNESQKEAEIAVELFFESVSNNTEVKRFKKVIDLSLSGYEESIKGDQFFFINRWNDLIQDRGLDHVLSNLEYYLYFIFGVPSIALDVARENIIKPLNLRWCDCLIDGTTRDFYQPFNRDRKECSLCKNKHTLKRNI